MSLSALEACPNCKLGKFEEDTCGVEDTRTCINCGYAAPNFHLQRTEEEYGSSFHAPGQLAEKYKITVNHGERIPRVSQRAILKKMREYLAKYADGKNLFQRAEVLFLEVIRRGKNKFARIPYKKTVAACAMLVVLRKAGIHIVLPKICEEFDASMKRSMEALREIKECELDDGNEISIKGCIGSLLEHHPNKKDRSSVGEQAIEVSKLLYDLKVSVSRPTMAAVAMYFALLSRDPQLNVWMKLNVFTKMYQVPFCDSFVRGVAQARTKLFILAKRLPLVSSTVKKSNCHVYIQDILKSRNILIDDSFNGMRDSDEDSQVHDASGSKVVITEQMRLVMPKVAIKNLFKKSPEPQSPDPVFVSMSEEIGEDEVPEEELAELIRSPEEIEVAGKIKMRLKQTETSF